MSNYSKTTDFAAKDSLPSGDSGKIIRGSEFETEFDNISTAIATKADAADPTFTGTVTIDGLTVNGNTTLGNAATDTVTVTADIASNLIPSADDTYNLGASGAEWNDLFIDGTANIDSLVADTADINGGTIDGVTIGGSSAGAITGTTITGTGFVTSGDMTFGDSDKAIFGAGSDLQIYHDGTNSYIVENGTGNLNINANRFVVTTGTPDFEYMIQGVPNADVRLYYNGDQKIATTSTGIDVTGTVVADGLSVNSGATNQGAYFVSTDTGQTIALSDSASSNLLITDSNGFNILTDGDANSAGNNATRAARFKPNKDVEFYEDTGTTAKFFWDASAERLGIGTTSPANQLDVISSSTATARIEGGSNGDATLRLTESGISGIQLKYDGANNLFVIGGGTSGSFTTHMAMTRDAGSIGIGTTSPGADLHIHDTNSAKLWITADGSNPANAGSLRFAEIQTGGNYFEFLHNGSDNSLKLTSTGGDIITFDRDTLNVGIGTSSPNYSLDIDGGTDNHIARIKSTDITAYLAFEDNTTTASNTVFNGAIGDAWIANGANGVRFYVSDDEKMRIDSSGRLLVGLTTAFGTGGTTLSNDGQVFASRADNPVILATRENSDGEIMRFRKDNSTVGSIGTTGGDLFIGTGDTTLRYNDGSDTISPAGTNGAARDGLLNLGNSANRFKDLYLSGGAYLGGTAAANKLDDYEEGTWTPTLVGTTSGSATLSNIVANYTKIGNVVHLYAEITADLSTHNIVGSLEIGGLPYSVSPTNSGGGISSYNQLVSDSVFLRASVSQLRLGKGTTASWTNSSLGTGASSLFIFNVTYRTA